MADDDLDAFFEDVAQAEQISEDDDIKEDAQVQKEGGPPQKKQKVAVIPRGVIVAAASTVRNVPSTNSEDKQVPPLVQVQPSSQSTVTKEAEQPPKQQSTVTNSKTQEFRLFVGNLSSEITDEQLHQHFARYPSLLKATTNKKGYGFVTFGNALEMARALREMDQTWLGSIPIRVKRSTAKDTAKQKKKPSKHR